MIWVSLDTVGMSRSISSLVGILVSLFPPPALEAAVPPLPAPPSLWAWRMPRDTLPPITDFLEDFSREKTSFLSFRSLLFLVLDADRRLRELEEDFSDVLDLK